MSKAETPSVALPKKYIRIWLIVNIILVVLFCVSIQYTNYIAKQMCGIITTQVDTYKKEPPPTATGKLMEVKFNEVSKKYHC